MPDADTVTTAEPGVGSVIETAEGVKEAGPDVPALAEATQREENGRAAAMRETVSGDLKEAYLRYRSTTSDPNPLGFEEWRGRAWGGGAVTASKIWPGAPVGAVTREQAGILETGPKQVTDEMVYRAQTELVRHESPTGASAVRAALKAALQG